MALTITHAHVATGTDAGNGEVHKAEWNANHVVTGTLSADDVVDGTTNKAYTATEKTKLAGIEAGADVTDAANVDAAGAFMKSTDDMDDITEGTTNKHFTSTEKTKLSGIATGATANSSDATLLARANHTGTQTASTISDFNSAADTRADGRITAAIGVTVQAYDADTAKLDVENQALTGGVTVTSKALNGGSTVTSGTLTLDLGDRPLQHYTNGGAHILAPGTVNGGALVDITNTSGAGAITTSGWTKVAGDSFTTTNGHKFRCHCSVGNGGSLLIVQALQ